MRHVLIITVISLLCFGCVSSIRQADIEQAFDNSLQRYAKYMAGEIALGMVKAFTGLQIKGEVVLCEPDRPISDSVLAGVKSNGLLTAKFICADEIVKPDLPLPTHIVPTGGLPFLSIVGLITCILVGLVVLYYAIRLWYKFKFPRLPRRELTLI